MKTEEAEIVIADCVLEFIKDAARTEWLGSTSSLECEIQENNITSPPEQLWYAAASFCGLTKWAGIHPQYCIAKYRVDFMVDPIGYFVNHPFSLFPDQLIYSLSRTMTKFVVEIDGFEWHDKTPEQAEHDKRRERQITQAGYRVLRYAAREVLRDPAKCVAELDTLVLDEVRKACAQLTLRQTVRTRIHEQFEGIEDP